jgi:hypothetical protein
VKPTAPPPTKPAASAPARKPDAPSRPSARESTAPTPTTAIVPGAPPKGRAVARREADSPLAAPEGWADLTDEIAEIRFLLLQGFEDEAAATLFNLRQQHPGHPDLVDVTKLSDEGIEHQTAGIGREAPAKPASTRSPNITVQTETVPRPPPGATQPPASRAAPARSTQPPKTPPQRSTTQPPARGTTQPPRSTQPPTRAPEESTASGRTPVARISPVRVASEAPAPARAPDPASLQVAPPIGRTAIAPSDSAAETLEFDVDSDLDDMPVDPAALSMSGARVEVRRTAIPTSVEEDSDETVVDLEFDRQDRTVVSKAPPRPPVFDDDDAPSVREDIPPAVEIGSRTVVARAPSAPAPYRGAESEGPPRTTVVPTERDRPQPPAPFGGAPPPGSTFVPGTSPGSGGFPAASDPDEDAATLHLAAVPAPKRERTLVAPAIPVAMAADAPAITGHTMPPGSGLQAVSEVEATLPREESRRGQRGRGRGKKERRPPGVRVIMLGNRGESVAERTIEMGASFDLGRDGEQPWSDDAFIEPAHARLTMAGDGIRIDELVPTGAVFVRVQARARMRDGDQLRVGQSLVAYDRAQGDPQAGRHGRIAVHVPDGGVSVIPLGDAGVLIGRELGDVTLPNDTFVSSSHCRIGCDREGIFVEDLDSSNGTYLRVRSGESIAVGQSVLVGQTQFVLRAR